MGESRAYTHEQSSTYRASNGNKLDLSVSQTAMKVVSISNEKTSFTRAIMGTVASFIISSGLVIGDLFFEFLSVEHVAEGPEGLDLFRFEKAGEVAVYKTIGSQARAVVKDFCAKEEWAWPRRCCDTRHYRASNMTL